MPEAEFNRAAFAEEMGKHPELVRLIEHMCARGYTFPEVGQEWSSIVETCNADGSKPADVIDRRIGESRRSAASLRSHRTHIADENADHAPGADKA